MSIWIGRVAQVGQVESDVVKDGKTTHDPRYFITTVSRAVADAGQLLKWTRGHWSRTASSSASGASSWQPGHPVAARDSPRRMNLAVVPSATSSHRARTPGRPVRATLGHATSRARTYSAHFTACRATLFYAPISLDLTRSRQVAP